MKKNFLVFFLIYPILLFSQNKADIGLTIGGSYYMGDINPSKPFYATAPAFGLIYRYNFNPRYALKVTGNYIQVSANDADFSKQYQQYRSASFNETIYDFAVQYEFNFLPYKFVAQKTAFTPYVSAGLGVFNVVDSRNLNSINAILPAAIGTKVAIGKRTSFGIEWSFRKTFTDKLDGVKNPDKPNQNHLFANNDWYYFAGIFFAYKLLYFKCDCPAYETNY